MAEMTPEERAIAAAKEIRAAVQAEREACAEVAETHFDLAPLDMLPMNSEQALDHLRKSVAAAIRARGCDIQEEMMDAYQFGDTDKDKSND